MLADAGPAAQALFLDATAASGGRAGEAVRGAIDDRMARSGSKMVSALNRALGEWLTIQRHYAGALFRAQKLSVKRHTMQLLAKKLTGFRLALS